jgi:adenylosuccinate synthase
MTNRLIVGTQWGDEGKGRIVDIFCGNVPTLGIRYQGGPNAGHTLYRKGVKIVVRQLPTSCITEGNVSIIGNGCVIDPCSLLEEISKVRSEGIELSPNNVLISENVHIITPYHIARDMLDQNVKFGTTGKGIGPCYESKYRRVGLRIKDVADKLLVQDEIETRLEVTDDERNYVKDNLSWEKFRVSILTLLNYIKDIRPIIMKAHHSGNWDIVFEGAQAYGLDIDHGDYPYISTSSNTIGGAFTGTGVYLPIDFRMGVLKPYSTRVGEGPFEVGDIFPFDEELRQEGQEFGATTGRPRKCGWLDCGQIKNAIMANGINVLALTKLDVLSGFPYVGMCLGYNGKDPVIKTMEGWDEDISGIRSFDDLPESCRAFVESIESHIGIPIKLVSVGPNKEDLILRSQES